MLIGPIRNHTLCQVSTFNTNPPEFHTSLVRAGVDATHMAELGYQHSFILVSLVMDTQTCAPTSPHPKPLLTSLNSSSFRCWFSRFITLTATVSPEVCLRAVYTQLVEPSPAEKTEDTHGSVEEKLCFSAVQGGAYSMCQRWRQTHILLVVTIVTTAETSIRWV